MTVRMTFAFRPFALLFLLTAAIGLQGQPLPPRIFFTDIQSGPKTGGQNNKGAFVTIYGSNFGSRPTVTVGGGLTTVVLAPTPWLWYQKMAIQLGPNAATGNIVVSTSAASSNGVPFTVRSGHIYFAATNGTDSNNGSYTSPFFTPVKCKNALKAGDICYIRAMSASAVDDYSANLVLGLNAGSWATPAAVLAYPGESVSLGGSNGRGIYQCGGLGSCSDGQYWIIGGLHINVQELGVYTVTSHLKIIGNEIQCPNPPGGDAAGCVESSPSGSGVNDITVWGNEVHNVGPGGKLYHGVYLSVYQSDTFDVSWNKVHDVTGCRGIQITADSGTAQHVTVHDNQVYNIRCDGINIGSVNTSASDIHVYNNLVYHAGAGPDLGAINSCLNVDGIATATNPVRVYNNTFYDCGSPNTSDSGMVAIQIPAVLKNNIIYSTGSTQRYFVYGTTNVTGSNNLYYGNGSGPLRTTGNINADPKFVNLSGYDFHLQSSSPAINAGVAVAGVAVDRTGIQRPQGSAVDIGAHEFAQGTVASTNACDVNGDGVVNTADVDAAKAMALGMASCTADLNSDGACNIVDVQRVTNAALGGTCRVGP